MQLKEPTGIVRLHASEVLPGRLGDEFRRGAVAAVIQGDPSVRYLWDALTADPERLPWNSPLSELSKNLQPDDDLTEALGDVFYFKPSRHSYIARKIEISGSREQELSVRPPRFTYGTNDDQPEPELMEDCWRLSRRILVSMGPPVKATPDLFGTVRSVVQQIKYQDSDGAHKALFSMMRNALGPWARIGYVLDQRREEMRRPFARRGLCDVLALLSFVPLIGMPLVQGINAILAPFDKYSILPDAHHLLVKAHVDSRYFAALCGTRGNIVTQILTRGCWHDLPINCEDVVVLPGARAKTAFRIKPTVHRVLQSNHGLDEGVASGLDNVTLLIGAK